MFQLNHSRWRPERMIGRGDYLVACIYHDLEQRPLWFKLQVAGDSRDGLLPGNEILAAEQAGLPSGGHFADGDGVAIRV